MGEEIIIDYELAFASASDSSSYVNNIKVYNKKENLLDNIIFISRKLNMLTAEEARKIVNQNASKIQAKTDKLLLKIEKRIKKAAQEGRNYLYFNVAFVSNETICKVVETLLKLGYNASFITYETRDIFVRW